MNRSRGINRLFWQFPFRLALVVLIAAAVIFVGCSDNKTVPPTGNNTAVSITKVTPADGSTGVAVSTPITVKFNGPVDTASVTRNFYLAGGQQMHEWLDSLDHYGGFNGMGMHMHNHMMEWIDTITTGGEFHWNDQLDSCVFIPDTDLDHDADYLCLFYEDGMHDSRGGMMGHMGGTDSDNGYRMFEFMTGM